ncbi:hypothetical protein VTJ49DRAFT_4827 [Mycothermus thermophilus]|uniref:Uncharacterized protein n=1 Tax=Humicola insolens TaxID=85995 RepID=A0ABR3V4F9_HUMIN
MAEMISTVTNTAVTVENTAEITLEGAPNDSLPALAEVPRLQAASESSRSAPGAAIRPSTTLADVRATPTTTALPPVTKQQPPPHQTAATTSAAVVSVPLTPRERVRMLVFASQLNLQADRTADFTDEELEALAAFQEAYDAHRLEMFGGRPTPNVTISLVALRPNDRGARLPSTTTSICIKGRLSDHDIKTFHAYMSQKSIRRLYSPLRLSYDYSPIRRPADEEHYLLCDEMPLVTLCGVRLETHLKDKPSCKWTSTIGGVIRVGDKLYAMTCLHMPDDSSSDGDNEDPDNDGTASTSTLVGGDYDDDVEPALILDPQSQPTLVDDGWSNSPVVGGSQAIGGSASHAGSSQTSFARSGHGNTTKRWVSGLRTSELRANPNDGNDWRLIPLENHQCFPNIFDGPNKRFITNHLDSDKPSKRRVIIFAGFGGTLRGTLLSSPAFLSIRGGPSTKVWSVVLNQNTNVQMGDSGAWVIDDEGLWVGMVTAASGDGSVYVVPAHEQLRDIARRSAQSDVALPSPLRCYLTLATGPLSFIDRLEFASDALSSEALLSSASGDGEYTGLVALTLAMAKRSIPHLESHLAEILLLAHYHRRSLPERLKARDIPDLHTIPPESRKVLEALRSLYKGLVNGNLRAETQNALRPRRVDNQEKRLELSKDAIDLVDSFVTSPIAALAGGVAVYVFQNHQPNLQLEDTFRVGAFTGVSLAAPLVLLRILYFITAWAIDTFGRSRRLKRRWLYRIGSVALVPLSFLRTSFAVFIVSRYLLPVDESGVFPASFPRSLDASVTTMGPVLTALD